MAAIPAKLPFFSGFKITHKHIVAVNKSLQLSVGRYSPVGFVIIIGIPF
jgi:hypothetical protein